ncbi:oligosaccharide flippase family protein [Shewanella sp. 202IG2-18]|uniref:oligosaccharide flippase family protein n=1 Tax=Parashewanella hymeniacidonis TaxID=2807618 RepID=UPI0019611FB4|nr:oligosaccharide flippase family protein [Parashewanella hymeniacidonis]MBM7072031.1 oligosaccharide flippase family protein [Parashewanella hymeniacidonis]
MRFKKLLKNSLYMFSNQMATFVFPFMIFKAISNTVNETLLGDYFLFLSLGVFVTIVSDVGMGIGSVKLYSKSKFKLEYLFSWVLIKLIAVTLFFQVVFFIFPIQKLNLSLYFLMYFSIAVQSLSPLWFFQINENMKLYAIAGILGKTINMILVFTLIEEYSDINYLVLSYLFGVTITLVILSSHIKTNLPEKKYRKKIKLKHLENIIKSCLTTYYSRVSVAFYTTINLLIIGHFGGASAAATYGMAEKVYQAGQGVIAPVSQVLMPFLHNKPDTKLFFKTVGLFLIIFLSGVFFVLSFSSEFLLFLFQTKNTETLELLKIFMIVSIVNFLGVFMGYPAFAIKKDIETPNITVHFGLLAYFVSTVFFNVFYGFKLEHFAYSLLTAELSVLFVRVILFSKVIRR